MKVNIQLDVTPECDEDENSDFQASLTDSIEETFNSDPSVQHSTESFDFDIKATTVTFPEDD